MNFIILGAGALGSIYAAYLARAGHQVSLIARGARAHALEKHGIEVTGHESFTAHCDVVTRPEKLQRADVLIVAIKTYDTPEALAPLAGLRIDNAFSVQNGVLKNKHLNEAFGEQHTLGSVSMIGGDVLPASEDLPGAVRYSMAGPTIIGEPGGGNPLALRRLSRPSCTPGSRHKHRRRLLRSNGRSLLAGQDSARSR